MLLTLVVSSALAAAEPVVALPTSADPPRALTGTWEARRAAILAGDVPDRIVRLRRPGSTRPRYVDGDGRVWTAQEIHFVLAHDPASQEVMATYDALAASGAGLAVASSAALLAVTVAAPPVGIPLDLVGLVVLHAGLGVTIGADVGGTAAAIDAYNAAR